jgi:hypothetical protein
VDQNAVNFISLVASLLALFISSLLAWRSVEATRNANNLAVVVQLLEQQRSASFIDHEEKLWAYLPGRDPAGGLAALKSPEKEHLREVLMLYQTIAYLAEHGIAERRILVLETRYRLNRTWNASRPYILAERIARGDELSYLNTLEIFVRKANDVDVARITDHMERGENRRRLLRRRDGLPVRSHKSPFNR